MSLSGEEQNAPMSLSGEEQNAPMSLSGEELGGPRVSRERAALTVVVGLALGGVVVGGLWAWLAPPIRGVVALARNGERVHLSLGSESDHFFAAPFMFVGFLAVVAAVAAVALWQWQAQRGPVAVAALTLGCMASAAVAAGVGTVLAHWRYGSIDIAGAPVTPEHRVHYVVEAPPVFFGHSLWLIAVTLLFGAAISALVYALLAVSTARDDLGAWPPVDPPRALTPVIGDGVVPSVP